MARVAKAFLLLMVGSVKVREWGKGLVNGV